MREDMAGWLVSLLLPVTWIAGMAVGTREITPPPNVRVLSRDALVIVKLSAPDTEPYFVSKKYNVTLRRNGSSEEKSELVIVNPFIVPPSDLLPEQTYCMTVHVCKNGVWESSPFGPEKCFLAPAKDRYLHKVCLNRQFALSTLPGSGTCSTSHLEYTLSNQWIKPTANDGPPNNLRMETLDLEYLLNWDWDFNQSPNATFSVERCTYHNGKCSTIKGCENITTTQCKCLGVHFSGECILRVSAYDSQRGEKSCNVIQFTPYKDTVIGPPIELKMQIIGNELDIDVSEPEGFKNTEIRDLCNWRTHLEYWTNSTHGSEDKENRFFKIKSVEPSTTYCAKAKMQCADSERSSQYSADYCITTDPRSYLVAWITGFAFLGIVVISVVLYICFCPLKRFIKHTFFPPRRLPSCIEKGFGDLDCVKHPFLLHKEEAMDRCYIVQDSHTKDLVEINDKNTSRDNSQDSGNCSNEGPTTGETITSDPNV